MLYINENPYANVTETSSYADKIRAGRQTTDLSKALSLEQTRDVFERSGRSRIIPGTYTKFAVINWPAQDNKSEMHEVMAGYYKGEVSKEDVKEFFMEYCLNTRDESTILNVYESFLDANYEQAVWACFKAGEKYASGTDAKNVLYYDADYYYMSEEIHELLQEAAKEYGEKYGLEIDASKRDEDFQGRYGTGTPNFNDKWNYRAAYLCGVGRMMDNDAVPPKGFSFFYELGKDNMGVGNSTLIVNGKGWSEKMTVPYEVPTAGRKSHDYFYLADLIHVSSDKEDAKWYNRFLNKLVINRIAPGIVIQRR